MELFTSKSVIFLIAGGVISVALCALARAFGLKYRVTPEDSFRRHAEDKVPLLGGAAIFAAVLIVNSVGHYDLLWRVLGAGLPLLIVGVLDDLYEISARLKIGAQILAACIWVALISSQESVYTRLGMPPILGTMVTILFLVTLMNAFNFLDGIDGQTGTLGMVIFVALGVAHEALWPSAIIMAAAVLGFLYWNFPPAKIYLGEVGSSFLGFATGALATLLPVGEHNWSTFWAINFIFGLPFVDVLVSIARRLSKGLAPWHADKEHFHHKLQAIGLNRKAALSISVFMVVISALTGIQLQADGTSADKAVLAVVAGGCLSFIYLSIHIAERVWGRRISVFGRHMIEKYLPLSSGALQLEAGYRCALIDLLPYFTEIQSRGITKVDRFASEFGEFIRNLETLHSVRMVGSYSIVVILKSAVLNGTGWKSEFTLRLQRVLIHHRVLRNMSLYPEGVTFYDDTEDVDLVRLLDLPPLSMPREKLTG